MGRGLCVKSTPMQLALHEGGSGELPSLLRLAGLREFGLDPPGYTAILYRGNTPVLGAEFGAPNPQKVLQYMKLQGRDQVFLMSRFIGEEWEKALRDATGG
jgi:hypothetical protein